MNEPHVVSGPNILDLYQENQMLHANVLLERAARERALDQVRLNISAMALARAEIDKLRNALAAEWEAHKETRKGLETAEAFGDEMREVESRLMTAEECLREIAERLRHLHGLRLEGEPKTLDFSREMAAAYAFLAGGAK